MVVGGGYWQLFMVQKARAMGLRTVVIDGNSNAPCRAHADTFHQVNALDGERAAEVARREGVRGVTTFGTNDAIITVAHVHHALALPGDCILPEVARRAVFKDTMRDCLRAHRVPVPRGWLLHLSEPAFDAMVAGYLDEVAHPLICKPTDTSGGKGITIIATPPEIPAARATAARESRNGLVLLEEYFGYHTLGVESFTCDGQTTVVAIADKFLSPPPHCVTRGVITPSGVPDHIQQRVREVNRQALAALGISSGPSHIDMVLDEQGEPHVIDVGPRLAGGPITIEIIPAVWQVPLMEHTIRAALGERQPVAPVWSGRYACSWHFTSPRTGVIRAFEIQETVRRQFRCTHLHYWRRPGAHVTPAVDSSQLLGFCVCEGDTFSQAVANVRGLEDAMILDF